MAQGAMKARSITAVIEPLTADHPVVLRRVVGESPGVPRTLVSAETPRDTCTFSHAARPGRDARFIERCGEVGGSGLITVTWPLLFRSFLELARDQPKQEGKTDRLGGGPVPFVGSSNLHG